MMYQACCFIVHVCVHFTPPPVCVPLFFRVPGVTAAEVSLPTETATVHYDSAIITTEQVRLASSILFLYILYLHLLDHP